MESASPAGSRTAMQLTQQPHLSKGTFLGTRTEDPCHACCRTCSPALHAALQVGMQLSHQGLEVAGLGCHPGWVLGS